MANRFLVSAPVFLSAALLAGCTRQQPAAQQKLPGPPAASRIPAPPPRAEVAIKPTLRTTAEQQIRLALTATDSVIRAHAIEAIREGLGSAGQDLILRSFNDPNPLVRFASAMAAGELRIAEARPLAIKLLKDPDAHVQVGALFALHRLGDTRHSAGLEEALRSADRDVRANACFALGRLGDRTASRVLRPMLKDPEVEVRLQAAEALWRLGDEEGLKFLVAAGLSRHPAHQMVGLLALAGPRDPRVIQHVRPGLESDYVEVNLVAARALGLLGSDEAYVPAINGTKASETRQRYLAALALGAIGRADAQDSLAPLLKDADPDVRLASATAILQLR